jgi:hypothetical protein
MRGPRGCGGGFLIGFDMGLLEGEMVNIILKFVHVKRC